MTQEELIKKCSDNLKEIESYVTSEDKKKVAEELNINYWTIRKYIKGQVAKLDDGIAIYNFLLKRVNDRKAALA